jgi:hypothetical protein
VAGTWDDYEHTTGSLRPWDWRERPDGPDFFDLAARDMRALGYPVSRKDLLAATGKDHRESA